MNDRVSPFRRMLAMAVLFGGSCVADTCTLLFALLVSSSLGLLGLGLWFVLCACFGALVAGLADAIRQGVLRPPLLRSGVTLAVARVGTVVALPDVFAYDGGGSLLELFLATVVPSLAVFFVHWIDEVRQVRSDRWRRLAEADSTPR